MVGTEGAWDAGAAVLIPAGLSIADLFLLAGVADSSRDDDDDGGGAAAAALVANEELRVVGSAGAVVSKLAMFDAAATS